MDSKLYQELHQLNPWLSNPDVKAIDSTAMIQRHQLSFLMDPEWDSLCTVLVGPRRAGKTTLGKLLCQELINQKRFNTLLYLNCDYASIREWLKTPVFIEEARKQFTMDHPLIFIDEIQRLDYPGLLIKSIIDLGLPLKLIVTGSSQLEIKSKIQEHLTGRQITATIYPFSVKECDLDLNDGDALLYGCYPQVVSSTKKQFQLEQIYSRYIQKDIIEILKVGKPDVFTKLITLLAHSSGQLVNYNQLALDCNVSTTTIRNHLDILERTFVIQKTSPFVGNKRTELTSNPIFYFIDNGFRNCALNNFSAFSARTDNGLLVENFVFQEILKFKVQNFMNYNIHYWRTKSGAEVDFVLFKNQEQFLPIEVKYQNMKSAKLTRGFHSFIDAYSPKSAIVVTKSFIDTIKVKDTTIKFIPLTQLNELTNEISLKL